MLLTLFLCMVNTLNNASNNSPRPEEGATALVRWLIVCLVYILLALFEYAAILCLQGRKKCHCSEENSEVPPKVNSYSSVAIEDGNIETLNPQTESKIFDTKRIDKFALMIFPPMFSFTTVLFWTILYKH